MRTLVKGENVIVYILDRSDNLYKMYGCATNCTLEIATDTIETSAKGSGVDATFVPTKNSGSGSIEGLTDIGRTGLLDLFDLRQKQLSFEKLNFKMIRTAENGYWYMDQFDAYITASSDSGTFGSMAQFNISFKITGSLSMSKFTGQSNYTYSYGLNGGIGNNYLFLYNWSGKLTGLGDAGPSGARYVTLSLLGTDSLDANTLHLDDTVTINNIDSRINHENVIAFTNYAIGSTDLQSVYFAVFKKIGVIWIEVTADYTIVSSDSASFVISKIYTTAIPDLELKVFNWQVLNLSFESAIPHTHFLCQATINGAYSTDYVPVPKELNLAEGELNYFPPIDNSLNCTVEAVINNDTFTPGRSLVITETDSGLVDTDETANWTITDVSDTQKKVSRVFTAIKPHQITITVTP